MRTLAGPFAFWDDPRQSLSGLFSTPVPDQLCVVSGGQAYVVDTVRAITALEIPALPVREVRQVPEHGLLLFADFTTLTAIDATGVRWSTPTVTWDELRITAITDTTIFGEGVDPTGPDPTQFTVDVLSGRATGGIPD